MQALLSKTSKSLHDLRKNAKGNKPISVPYFWTTKEITNDKVFPQKKTNLKKMNASY